MKTKKLIILITLTLILFINIGYSAFSKQLGIEDLTAIVRDQTDIRITKLGINKVTNGATSSYEEYDRDNISLGVKLPNENSTITYTVTITNYGNVDNVLKNITGIPDNLEYSISRYNLGDIICDSYNSCNLGIEKDINITIKYKSGSYNSEQTSYSFMLNFVFEKVQKEFIFEYTGDYQTFEVPYDGNYKIELWGAQGESNTYIETYLVKGGYGGYTEGEISLNKKEKLYIYIGESGKNNLNVAFNGGGSGVTGGHGFDGVNENNPLYNGNSGGGATDIRLVSGSWNDFSSLKSRIMVAGGGGGAAEQTYSDGGQYGVGGGLIGGIGSFHLNHNDLNQSGQGGTQTNGGANGKKYQAGEIIGTIETKLSSFGYGGNSNTISSIVGAGGGGGGYYGGGGGTGTIYGGHGNGGGGGSSFISGHNGCDAIKEESTSSNIIHTGQSIHYSNYKFTNTVMIDGNGYQWTDEKGSEVVGMPTHDGISTMTGNEGNGYAKITYLGKDIPTEYTYEYVGAPQTFTAPFSGTYKIELWGAQGGGEYGGKGAYTTGTINLETNENLIIQVGEKGYSESSEKNIGGYNGGGYSGYFEKYTSSYSGGGASDVRLADGLWKTKESLNSRIMVSAGGGGGCDNVVPAGAGGTLVGKDGQTNIEIYKGDAYKVTGGTQTSSGRSYFNIRSGFFGYAQQEHTNGYGGGGGGGYYGGSNGFGWSGSGGSSYISGYKGSVAIKSEKDTTPKDGCEDGTTDITCSYHYSNYIFANTNMIDGDSEMPTHDGTSTMIGNTGNGYAKITYIPDGDTSVTPYSIDSVETSISDYSIKSDTQYGPFNIVNGTASEIYSGNDNKLEYGPLGELILDADNPIVETDISNLDLKNEYSIYITIKADTSQISAPTGESSATIIGITPEASHFMSWVGVYNNSLNIYTYRNNVKTNEEGNLIDIYGSSITDVTNHSNKITNIQITSVKSGETKVYINGELSSTFTSGTYGDEYTKLVLGDLRSGRGLKFIGSIYDFALYSKALTTQEIKSNWKYAKNKWNIE